MKIFLVVALAALAEAQNPTAMSVVPAAGATGVPLNAHIIAGLTIPQGYSTTPLKLSKGTVVINGTTQFTAFPSGLYAVNPIFGWVNFAPTQQLAPNTIYTIEVDAPGRAPYTSTFTTGTAVDTTPPSLIFTNPVAGQDLVNTATQVTLRFSKSLDPLSFKSGQFTINDLNSGYSFATTPTLQADGVTLMVPFQYQGSIPPLGDGFQLAFSVTITDWLGNPVSSPAPISFTTARNPQKTGPVLSGSAPANGDGGVALNSAMILIFNEPLASIPYNSAVTVTAGGNPVKVTVDNSLVGQNALIIQPAVLLPANTQINVQVAGLLDTFGAIQTTPVSINFQTGALPQTGSLQATAPSAPIPQSVPIPVTFNRALDPAVVLLLGSAEVNPGSCYYSGCARLSLQLSGDGRTVMLNGALPAGTYPITLSIPFDRIQGKLSPFQLNVTTSGDADTTPPQVFAVSPPDGTPDAPPNSVLQVAFSELVIAASGAAPFQLLNNGAPVPGKFTINGTTASFTPTAGLQPSSTYQIQIGGITDLAGNMLPPFSSGFSTAASNPSSPFQVVSVVPANQATAVDPTAPISVTFNRTLNPVSVLASPNNFVLNFQGLTRSIPGSFQFSGATMTFTPSSALPTGNWGLFMSGIADLTGATAPFLSYGFQTAPPQVPDTTPPAVISVSPPDGGTAGYLSPYAVLTFSKPLDPRTVTAANLIVYNPPREIGATPTLDYTGTRVTLPFSAAPGSQVTIYVNSGVTDLAGNPAIPFRSTLQMSSSPAGGLGALVIKQQPGPQSQAALPNTSVYLVFSAPVDPATVEAGLLVAANGIVVGGSVVWTPDSTALTFTPSSPFPYSAGVIVVIKAPAHDAAGNPVSYSYANANNYFNIVGAPPPSTGPLAVVAASVPTFFSSAPLDLVVDVEFNQPLPGSLSAPSVGKVFQGAYSGTNGSPVPCNSILLRPNILRIQPSAPLEPNSYYIFAIYDGTKYIWQDGIGTGTATTPANPTVTAYGPSGTSVPLNSRIALSFSAAVSSIPLPGAFSLQTGGNAVPVQSAFSQNNDAVTFTPLGLLLPNSDYNVVVSGFTDPAGHPIPAQSWTFHTSSSIDLSPPSLVHIDPSGNSASSTGAISVTFSKPVAPDWIDQFTVADKGGLGQATPGTMIPGSIQFSSDQRTLFFNPSKPMPLGHYIAVSVPVVDDFAGNQQVATAPYSITAGLFRVAFTPAGAPVVTASTPDDGSTNLPLNAQIQIRFDQPVLSTSLANVGLFQNGAPIAASVQLGADGQTVTVLPQSLPQTGGTYTLMVAGVTNADGVAVGGPFQASFTFGAKFLNTPAAFSSSPANAQTEVPLNAPLRVRTTRPLNKLTVTPSTVMIHTGALYLGVNTTVQDGGYTILAIPVAPLAPGTLYNLVLSGVTDLAGIPLPGQSGSDVYVAFSTSTGVPFPNPALIALDPQDGSQNVPPAFSPEAVFSQPIDLTQGNASVQLTSSGTPVDGTVSINSYGESITFTPARVLPDGTYTFSLNGIADVAGNPLPPAASTFAVSGSGSAVLSYPRLTSSTPQNGAAGVSVSSQITLVFSGPVTAASVAGLAVGGPGGVIPGAWSTQSTTATFTPNPALPAAASILVSGTVQDWSGNRIGVYFSFKTGASPDTTPPALTYTYPANGTTVTSGLIQIALRFSKPVISSGTIPIQVFAGTASLSSYGTFLLSEDSQTISGTIYLPPASQITVAINPGLQDFAGNAFQPANITFQTGSSTLSSAPAILAISPPDGSVNVAANANVELNFSHPMTTASVQTGLILTNLGSLVSGALSADSANEVFDFTASAGYGTGSVVEVFASGSIYDTTGVQISPFHSTFTTAGVSPSAIRAISYSASVSAIDVRFSGAVPQFACDVYLHSGLTLVPARCTISSFDQIRLVPDAHLSPRENYGLVLNAREEIALRAAEPDPAFAIESLERAPSGVRIRFSASVNPLTFLRGPSRLLSKEGSSVSFHLLTSLDRREVLFVCPRNASELILEGLESAGGDVPVNGSRKTTLPGVR